MVLFDDGDTSLLKKWIVKRLEDISDADSDVLADYVLALLRHEQSEDEVKKLCIDQLDDFLREHTTQFVNDVFAALQTRSFLSVNSTLTGGGVLINPPQPPPAPTPHQPEIHHSPIYGSRDGDRGEDRGRDRDERAASSSRGQKRPYFDRDRDGGRDNQYMPSSSSSRGFKAARRGPGGLGSGRWTRGTDGLGRGGFHQQSPQQHPQLQQNQPPQENAFVSAAAPPQPPPGPLPFGMPPMPPASGFSWNIPDPNDPMAAFLAAQATWGGYAPMGQPSSLSGQKMGEDKKVVKKIGERCKDYDEKGFCMKGDMCPYEHGMDHIVVPGQDPQEEYDPNNSQLFTMNGSTMPSDQSTNNNRGGRGRGRGTSRGGRGGRSDISGTGPSYDRSNSTLVVEHIPPEKLTDSVIKEFFSKFGTVLSVEVQPHKHLAIVKFESWEMAKAAYDSPAAIFDNRFIKVFWYKPSIGGSGSPTTGQNVIRSGASVEPGEVTAKTDGDGDVDMEEFTRKQEEAQKAYEAKMAKKKANEEATKQLEKRREELLRLQLEERKRLMETLAKKQTQPAGASASPPPASAPAGSPPPPAARSSVNGGLKKAEDEATTAFLKAKLQALEAEAKALGIDKVAGEEPFDLGSYRGRGRGRAGYIPRVARGGYVPRGRATYPPPYTPYRGRGAFIATRGRGVTLKLDNRTRKVAVTAPEIRGSKDEEFRHYLMNSGCEVDAIEAHPEKDDTQIVTFKDRRTAEKFVQSGTDIPNFGVVTLAWHNPSFASTANKASTDDSMGESEDNSVSNNGGIHSSDHRIDDDAYDLAEDDEGRWLPE